MGAAIVEAMESEFFRNLILLIGIVIALMSVVSAKAIARRKQTADVIFACRNDLKLAAGMKRIIALHDASDANMRSFAKKDMIDSDESREILYVLNHFEYIAIGIDSGIYDEKMFKRASHGTIMGVYDRSRPFIEAIRVEQSRPTVYQELESLAARWKKAPLKKTS